MQPFTLLHLLLIFLLCFPMQLDAKFFKIDSYVYKGACVHVCMHGEGGVC